MAKAKNETTPTPTPTKNASMEQIAASEDMSAGVVTTNPIGQKAMNKLANEQGSYSGGPGDSDASATPAPASAEVGAKPVATKFMGGAAAWKANGGHPHAEGAPEVFNDPDASETPAKATGAMSKAMTKAKANKGGAKAKSSGDVDALTEQIAALQAEVKNLKSKVGSEPINFTGPGVTGPADHQVKPQKVI